MNTLALLGQWQWGSPQQKRHALRAKISRVLREKSARYCRTCFTDPCRCARIGWTVPERPQPLPPTKRSGGVAMATPPRRPTTVDPDKLYVRRRSISAAPVPYRQDEDGTNPVFPRMGPIPTGGGEITGSGGRCPCIVVYVRPVAFHMKRFERFLHATNCITEELEPGCFLVGGAAGALNSLAGHSSILRWHYVIDGRQPRAPGTGDEKPRPQSNKFDAPSEKALKVLRGGAFTPPKPKSEE